MPDLDFQVTGVEPVRHAASPMLAFRLRLTEATGAAVHTVVLRCEIRIQPARRRYSESEQVRLLDLFGTPERWGQTVRPFLWTQVSMVVPAFAGQAEVDLQVPCSHDFTFAATKYFGALEEDDVPLDFLFSGTVFHEAAVGGLRAAPIPWNREASYRLSADAWRQLMERYYPDRTWLCIRNELFERLQQYRRAAGLPGWEPALERLLSQAEAVAL